MTTVEAGTSELSRAAGLTLDAYRRDHVGERIKRALELARRGSYDGVIPFSSELRAHICWERRDLLRAGAAPGKWRLILCRNLAIYLAPEPKRALHERLAGALARGGVLLLGRSERIS